MSDIARIINLTGDTIPFSGKELAQVANLAEKGEISSTGVKILIETMFSQKKPPQEIVKEKALLQIGDSGQLESLVKNALRDNPKSIADYKKGKTNALGFLVGQCMKLSGGKANPQTVTEILKKELNK